MLLRRLPVQAAIRRDERPAITPSQMKAMLRGWIALVVVWDETGEPVPGVSLDIGSSAGSQSATTDGGGRVRVDGIEGPCQRPA